MKIGVLTYFGDLNVGTNLQAYATYKAIEKLFPKYNVELINIIGIRILNKPYIRNASFKSLVNDVQRISKFRRFVKQNFNLSGTKQKYINTSEKGIRYIKNNNYDCVVIGADTLLELHRVPKDQLSFYWLSPVLACKKVMVASSARNTTPENISNDQKRLIKESIETFSKIGVRDHATKRLIEYAGDLQLKDSDIIPDPTFSLDIDYRYIEDYLSRKKLNIPSKTVCLHFSNNDAWIEQAAEKLKQGGYTIASFRPAKFVDILLNDLGPLEQFGIYRYFSAVLTNRFHDTIFCLKNNTPFLTYPFDIKYITENKESKYHSLISQFNLLESNLFIPDNSFNVDNILSMVENAIDKFQINKDIKKVIKNNEEKYLSFLHKCLINN